MELEILKLKGFIIDPKLFELGFQKDCSPLCCKGKCCKDGVYLSINDKNKIIKHRDLVKKYMDSTQTLDEKMWFENIIESDKDFEDGVCDSTQVNNNKCTFLNGNGHCVLQVAASSEGMDKWDIKPYFCATYPIVISSNVITYDDLLEDIEPCCNAKINSPDKFINACKEEFLYILGEDGYKQLIDLSNKYEKELKEQHHENFKR
jgi:hypothetical protein